MSARVFRTRSEEETIAAGEEIGRELAPGTVILLIGELGAGKTTLAKGIVKGLGAGQPEDVSSPTFTLIQEYGEGTKVYHIDLFRIESLREAEGLGLEELLLRPAVVLVEWGERFPQLWPGERIEIRLRELEDGSREICCS
ncbi:MAG: tRNA (adenosine(37)-N6)-threonylcarbamoyltransferase complex ATPase subunit type 1 TsaE [Bryobacteraceae bacterium]|nr:tRNA (adenosine(37)-N6)-threonylcarbamoyltransferase complex ATPase subunit type 1 TsaE [Bryobacteraceae bacterium]